MTYTLGEKAGDRNCENDQLSLIDKDLKVAIIFRELKEAMI